MNITLDTQFSATGAGNTESTTITYKQTASLQGTGNVSKSGYILDIADKVMDNEAYQGHGLTADDIMQQAANTNVNAQKDFMIVMSNCVSGEDLQKMQEEGFKPGSTDVETYVNIVDKIKVTLAQAGVEVAGYNDDLDVETIEQITGSRVDANALVDELSSVLQESDMPVTNENITELVKAVMEAADINELSDDTIKYLVVNGKAPTIQNIYKAQYSSTDSIRQSQGYYSESTGSAAGNGKYFSKYMSQKADNINWENLKSGLESVVSQAGLDTDNATKAQALENAKWMVESGIELNVKNLTMVTDLKNFKLPLERSDITKMCVTAMENGKAPIKADMTGEKSIVQQAHDIAEAVENISDEAIHNVVESGANINIKNLSAAQKQIDQQHTNTNHTAQNQVNTQQVKADTIENSSLKEVEAKRQLEEIRLMMSEEANRHLLKAGISIDTTELSKLVEALKTAEASMKAALFKGENAQENAARSLIYEETLTKTKELADMPAAVLGKMASNAKSYTLVKLHEEGSELQNQHKNQNPNQNKSAAYETLMTQPRKDLGDKISKAFRNVDDILNDMNLETSEANRRAVRILGYNSMEITTENINAVKEADSLVSGVINKMTPATTLQMIREQKNPLEMTMEELENYLDNNKNQDMAEDAEKYSKFLQRLDRAGNIEADEREAYIGIYRMFRQIEKSDGAVIGSIVATGAEMNFKNMLSAVRTAADKDMDIRVDDGFGALENLISKGKAIDAQINAGYHSDAQNNDQNQDMKQQEKYYARLSGEINSELADKTDFEKIDTKNITAETTIEKFADNIKMTQMSENNPVIAEEKVQNIKDFRQSVHEVEQIDEKIIETLIDFGQSISVDNIQAASMLIFDRGSLFKQVLGKNTKSEDKDSTDVSENDDSTVENDVLAQADRFIENLTDDKQAKTTYSDIISQANKTVEAMVYSKGVSHIDVKAAKALYKGLSLAGNLSREENYEVPMNIKGEITSVNLKIYHNASQTGKVSVTLDTQNLGKVAAEFDVTSNRISAMIVYDTKSEKTDMEQIENAVKTELGTDKDKQINICIVHSKDVDLEKFGQDRTVRNDNEKLSTAELYQTAKAFLKALKTVE